MSSPTILLANAGRASHQNPLWTQFDHEFPYWLASLAGQLKSKGYKVVIVDQAVINPNEQQWDELTRQCDAAFIQVMYHEMESLRKLVPSVSRNIPLKNIGVFGQQAFYAIEEIINCFPDLGAIIQGETEHVAPQLVKFWLNHESPQSLPGTWQPDFPALPIEYISDLDTLAWPDRASFQLDHYRPSLGKYHSLPQMPMLSSRGCFGKCTFCPREQGGRIRSRSPQNIVEEMGFLSKQYKAREIFLLDETFTFDRDRCFKICDEMSRRNLNLKLRVCSRADRVDKELLSRLKSCGMYSIGYGIESGSDQILQNINKGIDTKTIASAIQLSHSLGIEVRGYVMLNLPGETKDTIKQTEDFIRSLPIDLLNVQVTYPFPNTPFMQELEQGSNYRFNKSFWNDESLVYGRDVCFEQGDLSKGEITEAYKRIMRSFYFSPKRVKTAIRHLHSLHDCKMLFLQILNMLKNLNSKD